MKFKAIAWGDVGLRVLACLMLLAAGYQLLAQSSFAWRLRDDVPSGVGGVALGLAAVLALFPLFTGRKFIGMFLLSGFLMALLGAHWWTTIPWEELITESNFNLAVAPRPTDYALVCAPAMIAVAYVALSRWSRIRTDLLARGVDRQEAARAAAASFLFAPIAIGGALLAAAAFIAVLLTGITQVAPTLFQGLPAVIAGLALFALAVGLLTGRIDPKRLRRPSGRGGDPEAQGRTRARRWPS